MGAGLSLTLSSSSKLEDSFVGREPTLPTPSLPSPRGAKEDFADKGGMVVGSRPPLLLRRGVGYLTFVAPENRFVREILF